MARKFTELRNRMSPRSQQRSHQKAEKYRSEMTLDQLRMARELTQVNLAKVLGVNQAAISKLERRTDMYLSTLGTIIEAMGGYLHIEAVFPDGRTKLNLKSKTRRAS